MQRLVTYACGDTRLAHILSTSPQVREEIVLQLQRSSCPACQRRSRYEEARRRAEYVGLCPLQATYPQQLALAEVIRVSLWELLIPRHADEQSQQLLAMLFNRQTQASFWTSLRGWALYRLTCEQAGQLLLRLLQAHERKYA